MQNRAWPLLLSEEVQKAGQGMKTFWALYISVLSFCRRLLKKITFYAMHLFMNEEEGYVTDLNLENNLPTFQLNATVIFMP